MIYYLYLAGAILAELAGTLCLKYSDGFSKAVPSAGVVIFYVAAFFMLAKSLHGISLSAAYATWSSIGIVAATLFSIFLFKESLNFIGVIGITMVVGGVIILNMYGTAH